MQNERTILNKLGQKARQTVTRRHIVSREVKTNSPKKVRQRRQTHRHT